MANISIDQLANEIARAVQDYTEDVTEAIEKKVDSVADGILSEVKSTSKFDSGDYSKGFKKTKEDEQGKVKRIIWNKKSYRLVHLLEFGHAKVGGGRVAGKPHLRPAYEKYGAQLPEDIKRIIRNGGGE